MIDLQLFPGKHILPYLVFERNSGYGHGVETWVQDANNEFAVPILLRDSTNNYRGGVRLEYNRWHVTAGAGRHHLSRTTTRPASTAPTTATAPRRCWAARWC